MYKGEFMQHIQLAALVRQKRTECGANTPPKHAAPMSNFYQKGNSSNKRGKLPPNKIEILLSWVNMGASNEPDPFKHQYFGGSVKRDWFLPQTGMTTPPIHRDVSTEFRLVLQQEKMLQFEAEAKGEPLLARGGTGSSARQNYSIHGLTLMIRTAFRGFTPLLMIVTSLGLMKSLFSFVSGAPPLAVARDGTERELVQGGNLLGAIDCVDRSHSLGQVHIVGQSSGQVSQERFEGPEAVRGDGVYNPFEVPVSVTLY
ncbi:hypothetical protein EK904_004642 [Melospiza melodia maxima]|nr:hypothetical protein EK904_004642 [Melospiza melodia maxima]